MATAAWWRGTSTATRPPARQWCERLAEEVGIQVAQADLRFVHIMHRKEAAEADERIDLFFTTTRWEGAPEIGEPEKCGELRWASLDALPANMVPYVRLALEQSRQDRVYTEFWPGQGKE